MYQDNQSINYNVIAQNINNVKFYAWIPRIVGTQNNYEYAVESTNYKYTPSSTGGYSKSSTKLKEYIINNKRLFSDEKNGILNVYTKTQNTDDWNLENSWMFPTAFTDLFNQSQVFNRDIKNN